MLEGFKGLRGWNNLVERATELTSEENVAKIKRDFSKGLDEQKKWLDEQGEKNRSWAEEQNAELQQAAKDEAEKNRSWADKKQLALEEETKKNREWATQRQERGQEALADETKK